MPVSWVTFDCYGTLIDWERGIADALAPLLPAGVDRGALAARYVEVEKTVEAGAYLSYAEVLDRAGRVLLAEHGVRLGPDRSNPLPASIHDWPPFPEVPAALAALRARGYRWAILSNVDRALIASSIARLGGAPDLLVTAEDARSYKPAPGHWRLFLERSGTTIGETVHVGASQYHDVRPAAALGFRTVFVNRHGEAVDAAPTRTLPDLSGLPSLVEDLAG